MANILDYIAWRGDLTLTQDSFNEVDSLILSTLSYVDFELTGLTLDFTHAVTIKEAGEAFMRLHADEKIRPGRIVPARIFELFDVMSRSPRYQGMKLSCYVNQIDEEEEKQFCAVTIDLSADEFYVAFRGTDDTIVGWKEDFNMSFKTPVPSQLQAVDYLHKVAMMKNGRIRLGGHSKGGNLAAYAAAYVTAQVGERIVLAHSFDGPGFVKKIAQSEQFRAAGGVIQSIVPQSSIIGMLLEHEENYQVVASSALGIMQHDPFSWEVTGRSFVLVDDISASSYKLDSTLRSFVLSMNTAEKEEFVDTFFYVLGETGAKTLMDLNFKDIAAIVKSLNREDSKSKKILLQTFKTLLQTVEQEHAKVRKKLVQNLLES